MSTPELVLPEFISLRNHPELDEKWLQERLMENPSLLGLGELEVVTSERRQPGGGRLDLLLRNPGTMTRYEVEIQLGSLDESHIIRTIEYWDIERRRYPQYDHIAVIVAEDVTSRFLNVISLFNGTIPLMAIQIKGVKVNGLFTLIATRVLDVTILGSEEEDAGETVNRTYWEQKASRESLLMMDKLIELIREVQPGANPNYNKHHIGLEFGGKARNFVAFHPNKSAVWANFKLTQDEELTNWLEGTGLSIGAYDTHFGYYKVRVRKDDMDHHRGEFKELITRARDAYFG